MRRNGKVYMQEYAYGKPTCELTVIGDTDSTGTSVTFRPDTSIFTVSEYDYDT